MLIVDPNSADEEVHNICENISIYEYIYIYKCKQSDRAKDKSSIDILNFYKAKDSDRERDAKHISLS